MVSAIDKDVALVGKTLEQFIQEEKQRRPTDNARGGRRSQQQAPVDPGLQQRIAESEAKTEEALKTLERSSWEFEEGRIRAGDMLLKYEVSFDENLGRATYCVAGRTFVKDRGIFYLLHAFVGNST